MHPANSFSRDVTRLTFSYLDIHALASCMQVCKKWKEVAIEDVLWRGLLEQLFPRLMPAIPKEMKVREYFKTHSVKTLDEVIKRIETFIRNSTTQDQKQSITCFFPTPGFVIHVDFGFYNKIYGEEKAAVVQEFLAFMGKIPEFVPGSFTTIQKGLTRKPFGFESNLDILCRLNTEEDSAQCINKIASLHDLVIPLEQEHIKTYYSHQEAMSKKHAKKGCIIA